MNKVAGVAASLALVALNIALAVGLFGGDSPATPGAGEAQCVAVPGVPGAYAVRSQEHGRVYMLGMPTASGVGVWAVDSIEYPNFAWSVNLAAERESDNVRAADVTAEGRSHLPTGWMRSDGTWMTTGLIDNNPAWRSVVVGITPFTHGVHEAVQCVTQKAGA